MSAPSLSLDSQIEKQMMEFGSGVLTDLDRFVLGPNSNCTIDGYQIENGIDYFGGSVYDFEPHF